MKPDAKMLSDSLPEYHYDPVYGAMVERVPEPYWKSGKQKPPIQIVQTAMDRWFVESSDGHHDGYIVSRVLNEEQKRLRWTCSCVDFTTRRQGSAFPWCKHIYHVYAAFHEKDPASAWIRFPFPNQAASFIVMLCQRNDSYGQVFWEDLPDLQPYFVEANDGKLLPGVIEPQIVIPKKSKGTLRDPIYVHTTSKTTPTAPYVAYTLGTTTVPIEPE